MSKYEALWVYLQQDGRPSLTLSFEEIGQIAGAALDHSFLTYKKELLAYGYQVEKISMKGQRVSFKKIQA